MAACFMDLLFLFYQRGTEIRLLRWSDIDEKTMTITFTPTKTEETSNGMVTIQIGEDAKLVLDKARSLSTIRSEYVIHNNIGDAYTASGIRSLFKRACKRAGISGVTLKDIRPMAATEAKRQGYNNAQIQIGLVHSKQDTTEGYIRDRDVPISDVVLKLPKMDDEN